jgi:hypothetical protein
MNIKIVVMIVMSICLGVSFNVSAKSQGGGDHFVFNLIGSGDMYESFVPDIDGDMVEDPAICFDTELVNMKNQQVIGTATDCLSNVTPTGTGIALVGTSYFHMPNGTLITRGNTTVQPVFHQTVTPSGQNITHITGASGNGNAIIGGTGRFANRTGTVRLSGMVDMTNFEGIVGDPIVFDCLFIIDLD